ncbi:MAG: GPW/gp25 family protein [Anaerolineae bacterium]|nr:GPW/gp25 family protein [Anaerolineae bacterium]
MIESVRGMSFPFRIDPETGKVAEASGADKIRQNVRIILATRIGERPMLREFGSRIPGLVHDPNDAVLAELAKTQATNALLQWEPRVLITNMFVESDQGELRLRLDYVHSSEPVGGQLLLPLT